MGIVLLDIHYFSSNTHLALSLSQQDIYLVLFNILIVCTYMKFVQFVVNYGRVLRNGSVVFAVNVKKLLKSFGFLELLKDIHNVKANGALALMNLILQ